MKFDSKHLAVSALAGTVSALIYGSGLFSMLFVIPIAATYIRGGRKWGTISAVLGLLLIVAMRLALSGGLAMELGSLSEIAWPLSAMSGAVIVGTGLAKKENRLKRFAVSLMVSFAIVSPGIFYIKNIDVGTLGPEAAKLIENVAGDGSTASALFRMVKDIMQNVFLVSLAMVQGIGWVFGYAFVQRMSRVAPTDQFAGFKLPALALWLLLIFWFLVWVSLVVKHPMVETLAFLAWNPALALTLLYGVQGYGILRVLLKARGMSAAMQMFVHVVVFGLIFVPGLMLIPLLGFPALGVSETWVKYREMQRSDET